MNANGELKELWLDGKRITDDVLTTLIETDLLCGAQVPGLFKSGLVGGADGKRPKSAADVTDLDLSELPITDSALKHLTKFPNLESLSLGGTRVAGAGLRDLAELKKLEDLDLGKSRVTDAGLKHLGELAAIKGLLLDGTPA